MERRLAAILAADVVGYSKLMERDEAGTLAALSTLISGQIEPLIARHHGRVVKLMGDGILAEFPSVIDAVSAAIAWQDKLGDDDAPVQFRIGVNLGDIMVQDGDIFGNGVNIAARLERLAKPGGICVSQTVQREVQKVLALGWEDLGELRVKNIDEPVHAFNIVQEGQSTAGDRVAERKTMIPRDKPSIAVLPFENMSGDAEQDYFSDGMAEDIITGLSRFRTLFVVARNSSFSFKGSNTDTREIGAKLGVAYLVQGSVRKAGDRVRISAQLIEAASGNHIWADRYDRNLEDVFAVQDEVAQSIIAVLPGRVQHDVAERASQKPTENMKAYELLLQGKALRDGLNAEDTAAARELFIHALTLDPKYARVYMYLADTYVVDLWLGLADANAPEIALELARKGAALDNKDVFIQDQLGYAYLCAGLWEDAEVQFEKTLSQIVNEAESMAWCGYGFLVLGRAEKAQAVVTEARRLDPMHPPALDWILGQIHFMTGRYDEAVGALLGEALLNSLARAFVVSSYALAGRQKEAERALASFILHRRQELNGRGLEVSGDTISALVEGYRPMWRREEDWAHLVSGLRLAGLPD